jgi:hypothetical protein
MRACPAMCHQLPSVRACGLIRVSIATNASVGIPSFFNLVISLEDWVGPSSR